MTILGFDPSLQRSGYAYQDAAGQVYTGSIRAGTLRGYARLAYIQTCFAELLTKSQAQLVVYETYSYAAPGRLCDLAELGGVLKLLAWQRGIALLLVPPTNLKQFATGYGRASKEAIVQAIAERWRYTISQFDEADAFVLYMMGKSRDNQRLARRSTARQALRGCQWLPPASDNRLQFSQ